MKDKGRSFFVIESLLLDENNKFDKISRIYEIKTWIMTSLTDAVW